MSASGTGAQHAREMHLDRFQLVDRITELGHDLSSLVAVARVPGDHTIFAGHFPGHPLVPGVLLAEFMAQTCGFLLLCRNAFTRMPFLAALREVNLRSFVAPGTELSCRATLEHPGSGYAVMKAQIHKMAEDKPACDGVLTFRVMAFPEESLRRHMLDRARDVGLSVHSGSVSLARGDTL